MADAAAEFLASPQPYPRGTALDVLSRAERWDEIARVMAEDPDGGAIPR